jgi:CRISPR-associated protein Csx10
VSELTLALRQPAQIGDRPRDDFVLSTQEYLPGTVVRGAFAAAWIARYGPPAPGTPRRAEFVRLFEGGVRFGALLRPGTEPGSLAVAGHKYRPDPARCQVVDYDRARGDDPPLQCPDCGSPLEHATGLDGGRPAVNRRTSVAISESGVALRGQLFTRETISPGQGFAGTLIADDPADLDILRDLGPVRVGGRRTTHGLAEVGIRDGAPPAPQRLTETTLVVRLRSPGIFADSHGRPRREPGPAELTGVLGVPARVARRWTRWQEVGGWHLASGLPKPAELAVCAGSAFMIEAERPVADVALDALARRGVGLRRHEGFGDLAPPPVLREGLAARQARDARRRRLLDTVAPLTGVPVRWPDRWPELRAALAGHAAGDAAATRRLGRAAEDPLDASVGTALRALLAMPEEDMRYVAGELGRL